MTNRKSLPKTYARTLVQETWNKPPAAPILRPPSTWSFSFGQEDTAAAPPQPVVCRTRLLQQFDVGDLEKEPVRTHNPGGSPLAAGVREAVLDLAAS